jgi:hypothetical protein
MSEDTPEAVEAQLATFDDLIAGAGPVEVQAVTLSTGNVVKVRGMTRFEIHLGGKDTDDAAVIESRNLSYGLVEPKITPAQALHWMKTAPAGGDVARVSRKIRDLSGLGPGADKS